MDIRSVLQVVSTALALLLGWVSPSTVIGMPGPVGRVVSASIGDLLVTLGADPESMDDLYRGESSTDRGLTDPESMDDLSFDPETLDDLRLSAGDPENLDDLAVGGLLDIENLDDATPTGLVAANDGTSRRGGFSSDSAGAPSAQDRNCADFGTQVDAQTFFEGSGGTAVNNVDGLDANGNGVACEDFAYGGSTAPSTSRTDRTGGASGSAGGGSGGGGGRADTGTGGAGRSDPAGATNGSARSNDTGGGATGADNRVPGSNGHVGGGAGSHGSTDAGAVPVVGNKAAAGGAGIPADCKVVAVSGSIVAASGCGSGASQGSAPAGHVGAGGTSGSGQTHERVTQPPVTSTTTIERHADSGTEIEIDRGGNSQGLGTKSLAGRSADAGVSKSQAAAGNSIEGAAQKTPSPSGDELGKDGAQASTRDCATDHGSGRSSRKAPDVRDGDQKDQRKKASHADKKDGKKADECRKADSTGDKKPAVSSDQRQTAK